MAHRKTIHVDQLELEFTPEGLRFSGLIPREETSPGRPRPRLRKAVRTIETTADNVIPFRKVAG